MNTAKLSIILGTKACKNLLNNLLLLKTLLNLLKAIKIKDIPAKKANTPKKGIKKRQRTNCPLYQAF